jgi:hypothetical protein
MQFLAISRTRTDLFSDADFAPLLEDEAQPARTLYIEGAVRQIWHRGGERVLAAGGPRNSFFLVLPSP